MKLQYVSELVNDFVEKTLAAVSRKARWILPALIVCKFNPTLPPLREAPYSFRMGVQIQVG